MALPVSPPPRSQDIASRGWAGLTTTIAWVLLSRGVRVRSAVLRTVREHVLYHLNPACSLPQAEDQAANLTHAFVDHSRGKRTSDSWPQDAQMPLSPRWRRALERSLTTPLSEALFRKHYGDNRSMEHLEARLCVDMLSLEAARAGLRAVICNAAASDGVPIQSWSPERIDRLLLRLASYAIGPCPPVLDVIVGGHQEHVGRCPRCDRTVRLVRSAILTIEDLLPPSLGARPDKTASILAIHFHPNARQHRAQLAKEIGTPAFLLGDDLLLINGERIDNVLRPLHLAAEIGSPSRDHIRGVLVEGPGHWSDIGPVGPLVQTSIRQLSQRTWGTVEGIGELPAPIPAPPSARPLWGIACAAALVATMAIHNMVIEPDGSPPGLAAHFTEGRGGIWTVFDVEEDAWVSLIQQHTKGLEVILHSRTAGDKMNLAVGDGSYRLHTHGPGILIVSTTTELVDLPDLVASVDPTHAPLEHLAELVRVTHPHAELEYYRR